MNVVLCRVMNSSKGTQVSHAMTRSTAEVDFLELSSTADMLMLFTPMQKKWNLFRASH
jgi:hypothetical protein